MYHTVEPWQAPTSDESIYLIHHVLHWTCLDQPFKSLVYSGRPKILNILKVMEKEEPNTRVEDVIRNDTTGHMTNNDTEL